MDGWFEWLGKRDDPVARAIWCLELEIGKPPLWTDSAKRGWLNANWPLPNVRLGVRVTTQAEADERIPALLRCPAAFRWVDLVPREAVDLTRVEWPNKGGHRVDVLRFGYWDERFGFVNHGDMHEWSSPLNWVRISGESGKGASPTDIAWIESPVRQCREAGVRVWVERLGSKPRWGGAMAAPIDHARGKCDDPSEWPESLRVREWPEVRR
jgi:protein gp37